MICAKIKKQMGFGILCLLFLTMLLVSTPCNAAGRARFHRFRGGGDGSHSELKPFDFRGGLKGNEDKDGDGIFGAEKRKVYTGPNPLHNR